MTRPKLLLADDSVTIRKVVELTFADEGVDVTTVADSELAMASFLEDQPDIVLVDVGLPGTTGYDLCAMIKGDESTSQIPVLLLVGSFEPFDQDAAERSGADGFLTKPFHSIRDLVNRVHELLGTRQEPSGDEVVDFATTVSGDDNEDIDDLYERSFAETVAIENYETVPAFYAEDTFSDEIIEEKRDPSVDPEPEAASPSTPAETVEVSMDASHHSVDEWLDDEMIETVHSADPAESDKVEDEAIEAVRKYEDAPAAAVDVEPVKEFDWSPAAIVTTTDEHEGGYPAAAEPDPVPELPLVLPSPRRDDHVTEELPELNTYEIPNEPLNGAAAVDGPHSRSSEMDHVLGLTPAADPSPELVEMIASRVIERLSDWAIREIAQEAVPRIAEKLMREALEEDRKK